jgi:hypothetical protein
VNEVTVDEEQAMADLTRQKGLACRSGDSRDVATEKNEIPCEPVD